MAEPESEDTSVRQVAWRQQADQQEQRVELPDGIHRRQAEQRQRQGRGQPEHCPPRAPTVDQPALERAGDGDRQSEQRHQQRHLGAVPGVLAAHRCDEQTEGVQQDAGGPEHDHHHRRQQHAAAGRGKFSLRHAWPSRSGMPRVGSRRRR